MKKYCKKICLFSAAVFFTLLLFFSPGASMAATLNVTTATDTDCTDGTCDFTSALAFAAGNNDNDVINVQAGTYNITATLTYLTDNGDNGHTLTIQHAGSGAAVLDGGSAVQIMNINTDTGGDGGDTGSNVTIQGITFRNGSSDVQFSPGGGGLFVFTTSASLTLANNAFSGNQADGTAEGNGGGGAAFVSLYGSAIFIGNIFSGNSTQYDGGGLAVMTAGGFAILQGNIFDGNTAAHDGGGAGLAAGAGILLDRNSFIGNTAANDGGGLGAAAATGAQIRSEERRVGKECRSRWSPYPSKKKP